MIARTVTRTEEIVESLREAIRRGEIPAGVMLPTERELQDRYAVSRSTVRRALADLIESGWAESQPNRGVTAKQGTTAPRSSLVAFVDHADCVHKTLFFYLSQLLGGLGFHLVHVDSTHRGTMGALEYAADQRFAAAVFWGKETFLDADRFKSVESNLVVIAVDHAPVGIPCDVVMGDHFNGAKRAVSHLIGLGRRQVALSGMLTLLDDTYQRMLGYAAGHFEHNRMFDAQNLMFSAPCGDEYDHPHVLKQSLLSNRRPDAVFVLHDISVPMIASTILDSGLRIPQDVAIVGFGNDVPFTIGEVGLTTIAIDWKGVADTIVQRLQHRMDHHASPRERFVLPTRLVVRGSCGAPRSAWQPDEYQVSSATLTRRMPKSAWREEFRTGVRPPDPSSLVLDERAVVISSRAGNEPVPL